MANMTMDSVDPSNESPRYVLEPACGAGQMILSLAKRMVDNGKSPYLLRVHAIDIDYTATQMCYINTTLWGIPCIVIHGDSLSGKVFSKFPNIHWIATELNSQVSNADEEDHHGKL
jgi:methylase of polypeptide subunit release factors